MAVFPVRSGCRENAPLAAIRTRPESSGPTSGHNLRRMPAGCRLRLDERCASRRGSSDRSPAVENRRWSCSGSFPTAAPAAIPDDDGTPLDRGTAAPRPILLVSPAAKRGGRGRVTALSERPAASAAAAVTRRAQPHRSGRAGRPRRLATASRTAFPSPVAPAPPPHPASPRRPRRPAAPGQKRHRRLGLPTTHHGEGVRTGRCDAARSARHAGAGAYARPGAGTHGTIRLEAGSCAPSGAVQAFYVVSTVPLGQEHAQPPRQPTARPRPRVD